MPITKLTPENNYPYTEERLKALEQAVPEAFADGKINWDTLREVLGEDLEDEARQEFFGLAWPGKREARKRASTPSRATLVPVPGEGVNEDETENLFIEGDNLEVLKLLQKSYAGKIKMIYIDPPYNTGNDFIYNDNFTDPLEAYLEYTGAKGEGGELLTTNTRADGRFHSKWLNMMYPRLILARQLLREDGVIFVSIGEEELHNLKISMSEVFGDENYISTIARVAKTASNKGTHFAPSIDFILVFSKNIQNITQFKDEVDSSLYKKVDQKGRYRDDVALYQSALDPLRGCNNQRYFIQCPDGSLVIPPGKLFPNEKVDAAFIKPQTANDKVWRWSFQTYLEKKDLLVFKETKNSPLLNEEGKQAKYNIYTKSYLADRQKNGTLPRNILDKFINRKAADYLKTIGIDFGYSKPYQLIQWLISIIGISHNDIVLDFFAGSCTTSDAVIRESRKTKSKIRFIVVQLPEKIDTSPYQSIADIGKERIRRVIKNIASQRNEDAAKTPLLQIDHPQLDLGFKVYKYTRSNFKQWKPLEEEKVQDLAPLFDNLSDPLVEGWMKQDLLSEILLLEGFPLTSQVVFQEDLLQNQVYRVSAPEFCAHCLLVCLDEIIQPGTADLLALQKEDIFVCLDSALSDELKARLQDKFNVHVI
ncbi:MAG: site-specific DNA-methyltransferase [Anaerolineaceae bacterium]|jgi:adenine-specific DNA-methyltransferase|nr:site-specific DNA-methyltransferase [Anaerolineaceae bacterium]